MRGRGRRHFIDRYFPGDYKVIPNGVDVARFATAVPIARWQDGTPNVLFVGRHEPRKGLLDLLKAHRILRRTGGRSRLLIVGSGPQEREAAPLRGDPRAQRRRIPGPRLGRREGPAVQDRRCLRLAGDRGESFGIVLLEAMAAGTPIIASDIHGYKASSDGAARACSCRRASLASWPSRSTSCCVIAPCASRWAPRVRPGRGTRGPGSRPRSTTTTASSSAAWRRRARCRAASGRTCLAGTPARAGEAIDLSVAADRRRCRARSDPIEPAFARDSANAKRQTDAE